jgi:hypothetical protein
VVKTPKFTPEQIQEMRDLRLNQKKKASEIAVVFKKKYQLDVAPWEVSYHCKPAEQGEKSVKKDRATKAQKKTQKGKKPETLEHAKSPADLHQLVDMLVKECEAYTAFQFKRARREIIKHIAQTRQKRIEAGEEVAPIKQEDEDDEPGD